MKAFIVTLIACLSFSVGNAQQLPKVFLLGEHEAGFDELTKKHSDMLLTVCDDNMNVAFTKWQDMLINMETYAEELSYDIKGSKMWLNIFWSPEGRIKHIAYYLKPNSRNLDQDKLKLFLISFMNHYNLPISYNKSFSHYGSASFPMISPRSGEGPVTKKKEAGELATENNVTNGNDKK